VVLEGQEVAERAGEDRHQELRLAHHVQLQIRPLECVLGGHQGLRSGLDQRLHALREPGLAGRGHQVDDQVLS
jgi:hypothetical protein